MPKKKAQNGDQLKAAKPKVTKPKNADSKRLFGLNKKTSTTSMPSEVADQAVKPAAKNAKLNRVFNLSKKRSTTSAPNKVALKINDKKTTLATPVTSLDATEAATDQKGQYEDWFKTPTPKAVTPQKTQSTQKTQSAKWNINNWNKNVNWKRFFSLNKKSRTAARKAAVKTGLETDNEGDSAATNEAVRASSVWLTRLYDKMAQPFVSGFIHRGWRKVVSKPLLTKILYTLLMLLIFRIAASITAPGIIINSAFRDAASNTASFLGILDLLGGGALRNFSIVTLGVSPYITASIIVQLITSEAFPPLNKWTKSGPVGKRKINMLTRVITLVFAVLQAVTIIQQLTAGNLQVSLNLNHWAYKFIAIPVILVAGSLFTLFLGEQITNRGVGNGTSLIIFSGIAYNLPFQFQAAYNEIVVANPGQSTFIGVLNFLVYLGVFLFLIFIIGFFYLAERRIPIQQTGAGLQVDRTQMSHLPIKLNPAGVMPIIFSLALSVLPVTIVQFLHHQNEGRQWVEANMQLTTPIGLSIFILLTLIFTIVMSLVTFNPFTVADGFRKSGTFIPGVRPGEETEKYLLGIVLRLAVFSAVYLSVLSAIQYIEQIIGLSNQITFGGTTLIILVSVALETVGQLRARDQTNKIAKARQVALGSANGVTSGGGLLW